MTHTMPTTVDETSLLLEVLSVAQHELGGVAGALQMRSDALDLGALPETAHASIRSAAAELARINATLRMLQAIRRPADSSIAPVSASEWYQESSPVLGDLMGRGYRISPTALDGYLRAAIRHRLTLSMCAFARALRERQVGVPDARRTVRTIALQLDASDSRGLATLSWTDRPSMDDQWTKLATTLAEGADLQLAIDSGKATWQWGV